MYYDYYGEMSKEEHEWHELQYEMWKDIPETYLNYGKLKTNHQYGFLIKEDVWHIMFDNLEDFYLWCVLKGIVTQ